MTRILHSSAPVEAPPPARPAAPREPIVRAAGVTKRFAARRGWRETLLPPWTAPERVTVVDGVSLEIGAGELFGLLGANGAGKSTLFRMLAGQLLPDAGTIVVDGCDVVRDPRGVHTRLTPVGTDERSLNWRLSARENLELYAALYGVERRRVGARVGELLDVTGLADTGRKLVGTFSSGMKQRLLIARALLGRPRVLLLDEPTRSLDPISARQLRNFLREEIVGRWGCTVLLSTHNAEEAFDLCDRVAVLERGRLLAVGGVRELLGETSDGRYRADVREGQLEVALRVLAAAGAEPAPLDARPVDGWAGVQLRVGGGADGAARALSHLAGAGVDVALFQKAETTLAEFIERIVERRAGGGHA